MPMIRECVPHELGIAMEPGLDPMTAVATGAAIFAENREWTDTGAKRRSGRQTEKTSGAVEVTYRYPETVTDENAQVRVKTGDGAPADLFVEIKDQDGASTGRVALEGTVTIPLRIRETGKNAFEARVTDGTGRVLESVCRQFTIFSGQASVSTDQVRQTIAVKVRAGHVGSEHNELMPLVRKGDPLPAEGVHTVRAAKDLRGGEPGFIAIEA
jgi:molecular chaperone DnaK